MKHMQETIERFQTHKRDVRTVNTLMEQNMQHLQHEAANMVKKIELLEASKRRLLGECLGSCTIEELQQIEQQLERSVNKIRARKMQVYRDQIEQLKEKEKVLEAENAMLCGKYVLQPQEGSNEERENLTSTVCTESSEKSDVETELFIGPPEGRIKRTPSK